jgi:hypothetical protein
MPNDRLRDSLVRNGLTPSDVAGKLGVDPKTVERWITQGRAPYPRYRHAVAAMVKESESYLWPDAVPKERAARITESEVVHIYPRRAAVPIELWNRLLADAQDRIQVLAYGGLFLAEQDPKYVATLKAKAKAGAQVTVLLGDPESDEVARRGAEEGIGDAMAAKIRNTLAFYAGLKGVDGVSVLFHRTTLYNSIYRYDDEMLVNTHVFGFPASHAPVVHLRRLAGGELFDTYADSFDRVRSAAVPAWPAAVAR